MQRGAFFSPGNILSLLRGYGQGGNLFGFVAHIADEASLQQHKFMALELWKANVQVVLVHHPAELLHRCAAADLPKVPSQCRRLGTLGECLVKIGALPCRRQNDLILGMEPQSRRKHGAHRVEEGAEIPLPQECRQMQHGIIQDRTVIQHRFHGL